MTEIEYSRAHDATTLCKACGLCCTGHLFSWVRLKSSELTPSENLGLNVIRDDPRQRGFTQPCPLWDGQCTVYDSPHYPRGCRSYNCKLLREVLDESIDLEHALELVQQTKELIGNLESQLPASSHSSFRERFIAQVKTLKDLLDRQENLDFKLQAENLMNLVENTYGVKDFFDEPSRE